MPVKKTEGGMRSGHFKLAATIGVNRVGTRYRIHNSGITDVTVTGGGTSTFVVKKKSSIDLMTTAAALAVSGAGAEGVYDVVQLDPEIRPGHFKVNAAGSGTLYSIIDLTDPVAAATRPVAVYRIFNTGENSLEVWDAALRVTLAIDQSVDIQLPITDANRHIKVKATAAGGAIEGVYEFLGDAT